MAVIPCDTLHLEMLFKTTTRNPDLAAGLYDDPDLLWDDPRSGYDGLDLAPDGYIWQSFIGDTSEISIDRGIDARQGIVGRPLAGVMVAKIHDPRLEIMNDPRIAPHVVTRLRVGAQVIFQGEIDTLRTEYEPQQGVPTTTIEVVDGVAALNSRRLDPRPAETYAERVQACCDATELPAVIPDPGVNMLPTDEEMTALDVTKLAADSEAGMVFMNRFNEVVALARGQETPNARKRAGAREWLCGNTGPGHQCLTGIATGKDTTQIVNALNARNIEWDDSDPDPDRHRWQRVTYRYDNAESQRWWGVGENNVTTTLDKPQLDEWATYTFARFGEPKGKVSDLTYQTTDYNPDVDTPEIVEVDVGDYTLVRMNDPTRAMPDIVSLQTIAGVQHRITPQGWDTRLTLLQPEVGYEPPIPDRVTYDEFTTLFDDVRVTYEGVT